METSSPSVAGKLVEAVLHHPDLRQAPEVVERMREPAVLPAAVEGLTAGLQHEDPQVRRRSAQALALLGPDAWTAKPALLDAVRDRMWTVREAVVLALAAFPPEDAAVRDALARTALHDRSPLVRLAAAAAWAGRVADAPAEVGPALRHPHASVRRRAAVVLGRCVDRPGSVDLLLDALVDGHAKVREAAAEALGEGAAVAALPRLVRSAFDGELRVQRAARGAAERVLARAAPGRRRSVFETLLRPVPPLAALRAAVEGGNIPPTAFQEVEAAVGRRLRWRKRQTGREAEAASVPPGGLLAAVDRLAEAAGDGDVVWLLGVLVEALLREP